VDEAALKASQARLTAAIAALEEKVKSRPKSTEEVLSHGYALRAQKDGQAANYKEAKADIADLVAEIAHFASLNHCPTCLAVGATWQERWKAAKDTALDTLRTKQDAAVAEGKRLAAEIAVADALLVALKEDDAKLVSLKE
jgi:hypothetical protein